MPIQTKELYTVAGNWKGKISNANQLGGIETSIIDNGPGKGVRIAWINTGTGLRYKVVIDRAMDIGEAFYNQHSLAWLSHAGITSPQPFSNSGFNWLSTFGGGLLTTCGLTHVGGPESDEFGERGLHGRISNTPAMIESIVQPDPIGGTMTMSITGVMKESSVLGAALELRRTISGMLGRPYIRIRDEITNRANTASPHMLMYHFNMGWPLADEGAELSLEGSMNVMNEDRDRKIFNDSNDFRKCPPPMREHNGVGECVAYFDTPADHEGKCVTGIFNAKLGFGLKFIFNKKELPILTNWQHWGEGEYVTGIEPCTHPPIGQASARKNNSLIFIAPGETKTYELTLEIVDNKITK